MKKRLLKFFLRLKHILKDLKEKAQFPINVNEQFELLL